MTASEYLAAVEACGGTVCFEGSELTLRAPKGRLTPEVRALWPQMKAALVAFAQDGWERDAQARAEVQVPAHCAACGCALHILSWEDPATAICLECCRRQYAEEVAEERRRAPVLSAAERARLGLDQLAPCRGGCGAVTPHGWFCLRCVTQLASVEVG